jgi:hypothetical protein
MHRTLLFLTLSPALLVAASGPSRPVTFAGQIAPIIFKQCASCHHTGEAAPFSLTSYADVKKRGTLIGAPPGEQQAAAERHRCPSCGSGRQP